MEISDEFVNNKYFLEKSKDDKYIIKMVNGEKNFYIGSKYSVQRDIDQFIKQVQDFNVSTIFVIFGLGAGEHIVELLKKISPTNKVLVIEPCKKVIEILINDKINAELFNNNMIYITDSSVKIVDLLGGFIDEVNVNNIQMLVYANYDKIYNNQFKALAADLHHYVEISMINMNTNIGYSKDFFKCYMKNLKQILDSSIVNEFKGKLNGVPAIIVSAGPSLEKNIELLKEVKGKFIIITGIRTVMSLTKHHIKPDIVCAIDATEAMYEVAKPSLDCEAPLVFCENTNYKILEEYKGKRIFFKEGMNLLNLTNELTGLKIDTLWSGGSVAHNCTAFARYAGCNPIIFIGQDFAYTNEKYHADSASIAKNNKVEDSDIIYCKDINGEDIKTSLILDVYRKNMEQFIRSAKDTLFINSTEGGALMDGAKTQPLRNTIDEYILEVEEFNQRLESIMAKQNEISSTDVLAKVKEIKIEIETLRNQCKSSISSLNNFIKLSTINKDKDISPLLKKINDINKKITRIELIENLLKPTIYKVMMNHEFLEKVDDTQKVRELKLAKQVKSLYEGIIKSIDESMPSVEECITELNNLEDKNE
ncbi:MAG: motility associated factor glycosyltransferase family protein [Solirubrobacterales bacterium]